MSLSSHYVPGTVLGTEVLVVDRMEKTDTIPVFTLPGRGETDHEQETEVRVAWTWPLREGFSEDLIQADI